MSGRMERARGFFSQIPASPCPQHPSTRGLRWHSTPEAEIVAADVAMRSMGMPALKLVERVLKKSPNFAITRL